MCTPFYSYTHKAVNYFAILFSDHCFEPVWRNGKINALISSNKESRRVGCTRHYFKATAEKNPLPPLLEVAGTVRTLEHTGPRRLQGQSTHHSALTGDNF